jgi:N,N'-diacetylchitobiose transport system permease protein
LQASGIPRRPLMTWLANIVGILATAVLVFPVYWLVTTAFKRGKDMQTYVPHFLPFPGTLQHFRDALHKPYFLHSLLNSAIVTFSVVVLAMFVAFFAAIAIARTKFRGRKAYIVLIMGIQMIPQTALILPLYLLLVHGGLNDRLIGLVVTYMTFILPFAVWTLRGFVVNVPKDLEDAAMIDGCSRVGAFMRVTFPLIAPGLVATSIFSFIQAWNEYIYAYVLLQKADHQTVNVWLANFITSRGVDFGGLMAGATIIAIPIVIFFLFVQKYVATGLTAGAVKG